MWRNRVNYHRPSVGGLEMAEADKSSRPALTSGSRLMCRMDRYGFPRTSPKQFKRVRGFQTGDIARAVVPDGKKQGTHSGRVACALQARFELGKLTASRGAIAT